MTRRTVLDLMRDIVVAAKREITSSSPDALRRRIELLDRIEGLRLDSAIDSDEQLARSVDATRAMLDDANEQVYDAIRVAIQRGDGARVLRKWIPRAIDEHDNTDGYDYLDEIVAGVLRLDEPGPTRIEPTAEMVFYQPTPARHVLDLFDRALLTANDVLVDLGAGLGHVTMLTAICSDARSIGVEVEPAYVACARRAASALRLDTATFIDADARDAPLGEGTIFFLYTPFSGAMLQTMLARLRREATTRDIRIATFGPCTTTIAAETWLTSDEPTHPTRVAIFHSKARDQGR